VDDLRKSNKDLTAKLSSSKLYECTEAERKKIDSMKQQLEQLCRHIEVLIFGRGSYTVVQDPSDLTTLQFDLI